MRPLHVPPRQASRNFWNRCRHFSPGATRNPKFEIRRKLEIQRFKCSKLSRFEFEPFWIFFFRASDFLRVSCFVLRISIESRLCESVHRRPQGADATSRSPDRDDCAGWHPPVDPRGSGPGLLCGLAVVCTKRPHKQVRVLLMSRHRSNSTTRLISRGKRT